MEHCIIGFNDSAKSIIKERFSHSFFLILKVTRLYLSGHS